jgi:hypothetical protein
VRKRLRHTADDGPAAPRGFRWIVGDATHHRDDRSSSIPIITVSRGSGSGGQDLAERVAARLGFEVVSPEQVVHEAAAFGAPEDALQKAVLDPPGLWDRFQHERRR